MKVIFTENVKGVATRGDSKNVKRGFYRNYLQPFNKAVVATEATVKEWEGRRANTLIGKEQLKSKIEEIKQKLAGGKIKIEKKITKKGTLYGGVKASDIVAAVAAQFKLELPETAVIINTPIKAVGIVDITLQLGEGVTTTLPIEVVEKK